MIENIRMKSREHDGKFGKNGFNNKSTCKQICINLKDYNSRKNIFKGTYPSFSVLK